MLLIEPESLTSYSDQHWMQKALDEAVQSGIDVPVGCVIIDADRKTILGSGSNEREKSNDPTAHAEIVALRKAAAITGSWRLSNVTLYTTLEPCPMCAEAILQARVKRVVFGAYDIKSGALGSAFNLFCKGRLYPLPTVTGGVLEEQCRNILISFFRSKTPD